jgi:Contractile injection system tape measure protein
MSAPAPIHRIRRQRWEVRAPNQDSAFALRTRLRRDLETVLAPAIEKAFDECDVGDEIVRIPRLQIHCRVQDLDELAWRLPALIREQIEAALALPASDAPEPRRRSLAAEKRHGLLHYLRTGQLSWNESQLGSGPSVTLLQMEAGQLAQDWLRNPESMRQNLPFAFADAVAFGFRFLQLLSVVRAGEWLSALLEATRPHLLKVGTRFSLLRSLGEWVTEPDSANPFHPRPMPTGYARSHFQAIALALAITPHPPDDAVLASELSHLPGIDREALSALLAKSPDIAPPSIDAGSENPLSVSDLARNAPEEFERTEARTALPRQAIADEHAEAFATPSFAQPRDSAKTDDPDAAFALRVPAAGLVLAHPFLIGLLSERQLLSADQKAISPPQLPHAAALLHCLACGRGEIFEYDLGLIKTLLGLRPADPLPVSESLLDEGDREECSTLLNAIITHWSALKGTSVEGLQASFLRRQGLLRENASGPQPGWHLRLENESFDVLLAQLPWSIGIVKLPWMAKPLFTEWPTH